MGLFKKKNPKSTLRFCQSAVELDTFHLFSDMDLSLALSQLSEWHNDAAERPTEANAYGVVHDSYGHGQPLLPVEVKFSFSASYSEGEAGYGSIWKTSFSETEYYKAEVVIHDPDRAIYDGFRRTFEHAAMSGNQYAHLILRRERKPFVSDLSKRDAEQKAERERIKALMVQVEAGDADMPSIAFNRVAFDDSIVLKAPGWSRDWHDDVLDRVKYHSKEAATWRNMPWRR